MNILKALNYNKHVDTVDILIKFIEVENPCRIVIETDYIKGLFDRVIKPNSLPDIHFKLINQYGDIISIVGVKSISTSRVVNTHSFSMLDDVERQLFNDESSNRKIVLNLSEPLRLEDLNNLMKVFHINVDHYSFVQEYGMDFIF